MTASGKLAIWQGAVSMSAGSEAAGCVSVGMNVADGINVSVAGAGWKGVGVGEALGFAVTSTKSENGGDDTLCFGAQADVSKIKSKMLSVKRGTQLGR